MRLSSPRSRVRILIYRKWSISILRNADNLHVEIGAFTKSHILMARLCRLEVGYEHTFSWVKQKKT